MQESMYDDDLTDNSEAFDIEKSSTRQQRKSIKTPKVQLNNYRGSLHENTSYLISS